MADPMLSSPMIVGDPEILASILKEGVNKFRLKGEPKSKVEAEHFCWHQEFHFSLWWNIFV